MIKIRPLCLLNHISRGINRRFSGIRNFANSASKSSNFLHKALERGEKTALVDRNGVFTYSDLAKLSLKLTHELSNGCSLQGERVAFITPNDVTYVTSQWSTWLSGGICVPLCKSHPPSELQYVLEDSKPKIVISTPEYSDVIDDIVGRIGARHIVMSLDDFRDEGDLGDLRESRIGPQHNDAMLIYTSGTTGRPKGALWTHEALDKQVQSMLSAWSWSAVDTLLHVLPLHHWHGIVNTLMCPLSIGATVVMKNKFDAKEVWDHLLGTAENSPEITVFMAVPTIYVKLLQYYDENLANISEEIYEKCKKIRLMVSGSAALPSPVFKKWKNVTSHNLLERYGMTEVGMALTNSYNGARVPGMVGLPFPGMEAKIVAEDRQAIVHASSSKVTEEVKGQDGELLIRGAIFKEYWGKPEATMKSFTNDWFQTGDTATVEDGLFKIVGRTSVDVIKSGGYKISALDVERHLLDHNNILEVAVLGVPDDTWGQRVGGVIVLKDQTSPLTVEALKNFCGSRMAPYCAPTLIKIVSEIPKNAMGKVNKKKLVDLFNSTTSN